MDIFKLTICIITIIVLLVCDSKGQALNQECTSDIQRNGESCQIKIKLESDLLKDHFGGHDNRPEFCRSEFEVCVQSVQKASDLKCNRVNAADETYHAEVNAMRGFCRDIASWQAYKPCVDQQLNGGIYACREQFFKDRTNYSRTEYDKDKYGSDFQKRNAYCRLIRGNQDCNERVIYAYCRDYFNYFRDFQVALLSPYCRQLFQLSSKYVTDDPNTASSSVTYILIPIAVLFGFWVKRLT